MKGIKLKEQEKKERTKNDKNYQKSSSKMDPMDCSLRCPPSMGFSRQEYGNGLPFPSPEDLPDPGIEPGSPTG